MRTFLPCLVPPLLLAGCATSAPRAALPAVQTQLNARGDLSVAWPLSAKERAEVDQAVASLLAADLTPDSAARIALLNNRSLRATFEELGLSQARLAAATRLPNPALDTSVRWPSHSPRGPNVEFGLTAPLLESVLLPARRQHAEGELRQTQYLVSHSVITLAAEVRHAAYEVLAQQDLRARLTTLAEISEAAAEFGQRQFDAGNINELDRLQLQAAAQQSRVEMIQAEASVAAAREQLNRLLGLSSSQTNWKMSASLPELPEHDAIPDNAEAVALQQRLDLAALHAQAAVAKQSLELKQRTRLLPGHVELGVDTEHESGGERLTGPSLGLELPLFDQGQPELARLAAEFRQTSEHADALAAEIGSEVRATQARLDAARSTAALYQGTLLPQRTAILRETLLHYNAMQKGVYELLVAKEQQQLTERQAIEARRDYWLARADLERALGQFLPVTAALATPAEPATESAHQHHHH